MGIGKKGDVSANQLITIIILIISFAVIVIFIVNLNLKSETEREACRNSVALRGSLVGKSTTLNCKTIDVCISSANECTGAGKDTIIMKVTSRSELLDAFSDLMYDCWWQMGEGKIDYESSGIGTKETYCAICNTIKFDDKTKQTYKTVTLGELFEHLRRKKVSGSEESYLKYIYGVDNIEEISAKVDSTLQQYSEIKGVPKIDFLAQEINLEQKSGYALVTGMTKEGWGEAITAAAGGAIVGFYVAGPIGAVIGAGAAGGVTLFMSSGGAKYLSPTFYPFESEALQKLQCKSFSTLV